MFAGRQGPPIRSRTSRTLLAICSQAEHDRPDVADRLVKLVGCGRYPVPGRAVPDDAASALQAQPGGKQPVHDVPGEPGHRFLKRLWLVPAPREPLTGTPGISQPQPDGRV